jgi:hypothetical protein
MNIAYQNQHMMAGPSHFLPGDLVASGREGYVRVVLPDGEVLSVQPDGSLGTRPEGTDGPWEQAKRSGSVLAYSVNGNVYGLVIMDV